MSDDAEAAHSPIWKEEFELLLGLVAGPMLVLTETSGVVAKVEQTVEFPCENRAALQLIVLAADRDSKDFETVARAGNVLNCRDVNKECVLAWIGFGVGCDGA